MFPSKDDDDAEMVNYLAGNLLRADGVFLASSLSNARQDTVPALAPFRAPVSSFLSSSAVDDCGCEALERIEDSEIVEALEQLTASHKSLLGVIVAESALITSIVFDKHFSSSMSGPKDRSMAANLARVLVAGSSSAELNRLIEQDVAASASVQPSLVGMKRPGQTPPSANRKRSNHPKTEVIRGDELHNLNHQQYQQHDAALASVTELIDSNAEIDSSNSGVLTEALKYISLLQVQVDAHFRFEIERRVIERSQKLAESGMWSNIRIPKCVEPPKPYTNWDRVLGLLSPHAAKSLDKFKSNAKVLQRRLIAELQKRFRGPEEDEKTRKKLGGQIARMMDKYWKGIGKMYRAKQKLVHEQHYRHALDAHLRSLIKRSKAYTRLVRVAVDDNDEFRAEDVDEDDDFDDDDDDDDDEEDDLAILEREGEMALDELVVSALPESYRKQWASMKVFEGRPTTDDLPEAPPEKRAKSDKTAIVEVPSLLKGNLRPYQHTGVDWLSRMYMNGLNGILADEMGLGKTIQTIAFMAHLACEHSIWGPHLVVVPTSVVLNWEVEFKRWFPGFKLLTYYGSIKERRERRQGWTRPNAFHVCITSYQTAVQDAYILKRKRWNLLVLDEAQNIKNFKSQRWQVLLGFKSRRRLLLTGTVLQNTLMELWSLMHFLMPRLFARHRDFREWFSSPLANMIEGNQQVNEQLIRRLHQVLRPFILRRLKSEVEREMPKKYEHVIKADLSKRQKFLYEDFMCRSDTRQALETGHYMSVINVLMQLRKVCNHPDLFETRPIHSPFVSGEPLRPYFKQWMMIIDSGAKKSLIDFEHYESKAGCLRALQLAPKLADYYDDYYDDDSDHEKSEEFAIDRILAEFMAKNIPDDEMKTKGTYYTFNADGQPTQSRRCHKIDSVRSENKFKNRVDLLDRLNRFRLNHEIPYFGRSTIAFFTFPKPRSVRFDDIAANYIRFHSKNRIYVEPVTTYGDVHSETTDPIHPDRHFLQYDSGKLQILSKLLASLKQGNHRVLIFSQMTRMLDIIAQFLAYHGYTYLRLDGTCSIERRQRMVETFNQNQRYFCFILSTRSGGLGLNLTGADTVVFYDSDWNPTMDAQAQDRCHRIGQTREVHVYRLICRHSVEENILLKANQKRILSQVVIEAAGFSTARMTKQNIQSLFFTLDQDVHENVDELLEAGGNSAVDPDVENALLKAEDEFDRDAVAAARAEAALDGVEFMGEENDEDDGQVFEETQEQVRQIQYNIESLTAKLRSVERRSLSLIEKNPEDYSHVFEVPGQVKPFAEKFELADQILADEVDDDESDGREDEIMFADEKTTTTSHRDEEPSWMLTDFFLNTPISIENLFLYDSSPYGSFEEDPSAVNSDLETSAKTNVSTHVPADHQPTTDSTPPNNRTSTPKPSKDVKPFGQVSLNLSKHIANCDAAMAKAHVSFKNFHQYACRVLFQGFNRCRNARVYSDVMLTLGSERDRSMKNLKTYWEHIVSVAAAVAAESASCSSKNNNVKKRMPTKKTKLTDIRRNEYTIPCARLDFGGLEDREKIAQIHRNVAAFLNTNLSHTVRFPNKEKSRFRLGDSSSTTRVIRHHQQQFPMQRYSQQIIPSTTVRPPFTSILSSSSQRYHHQSYRHNPESFGHPARQSQPSAEMVTSAAPPLPPIHTLSTYQQMMQQQSPPIREFAEQQSTTRPPRQFRLISSASSQSTNSSNSRYPAPTTSLLSHFVRTQRPSHRSSYHHHHNHHHHQFGGSSQHLGGGGKNGGGGSSGTNETQ